MAPPVNDLTGMVFERLTVLHRDPNKSNRPRWVCQCQCGKILSVEGRSLVNGSSKSCGCYRQEALNKDNDSHGMKNTREYSAWSSMKARCLNPNNKKYPNYGGRGIQVCDRWVHSFPAFFEDLGPSNGLSLGRLDNSQGYFKENCKWMTAMELANIRSGSQHSGDLTGMTFGYLLVLGRDTNSEAGKIRWRCQCTRDGNIVSVQTDNLKSGHSTSCGCANIDAIRQANTTHGMRDTSEYATWYAMLGRCYNPNNPKFPSYGGRGIQVCDHWRHSFENFYADMGPSNGLTIDRINNSLGYFKENCRWADPTQQANNRRSNHWIEFNGEYLTIAQLVERFQLPYNYVYYWLTQGMSPEAIVELCLSYRD